MNTAQAINGEIASGDWVIVTPEDKYGCLIGQVTEIVPHGLQEYSAENLIGNIHVNFVDVEYSEERRDEIVEQLGTIIDENRPSSIFDLDDVIMPSDRLIKISGPEISDAEYDAFETLLESYASAQAHCDKVLKLQYDEKYSRLMERLDTNYSDYHASLLEFGKAELIDMAAKIAAVIDSHSYLTSTYGFDESEIDYLLNFQNPLEVISDEWALRQSDKSDMSFAVYDAFDKQDALQGDYALMSDLPARTDLRRFMGVDLIDFLGKIADKTIIHYPADWNTDINALYRAADSRDPEEKRLMWHVSSYGTHINTELETFIRDTSAFGAWVDYRPNEPDMLGYVVEVTGRNGHVVTGNVFEVGNYAEHARHVRETALPLDSVTLTYSDDWGVNAGKTITVPRLEYDNDRHFLMSESGDVIKVRYHPGESEKDMSSLLQSERSKRMAYPIGSMEAHLEKISAILAAARNPPEQSVCRKKPSIGDRIRQGHIKAEAYKVKNVSNVKSNAKGREK